MYTPAQLAFLHVLVMYKSSYRSVESERLGLGRVNADNPLVQFCENEGFLTINRNGSIVPDKRKIQDVCKHISRSELQEYRSRLENLTLTFPSE